jgi:hypothetical protein
MVTILGTGCNGSSSGNGPDESYNPVIDPAKFSTTITNTYLPLIPGTTFIYEGESEDGPETTTVVVTSNTREVMGVTCVVVRDTVEIDGEVVEDTYDWYAQDDEGNVWYFGEDTTEYEDGVAVSTEGSWEAGVDGAKPGIIMLADPQVGNEYRQEYYYDEAEDEAKVFGLDASVTVPFGSYTGCLQTEEWTDLEPDVAEYKYYAPGVGLVLEEGIHNGERAELIDISN